MFLKEENPHAYNDQGFNQAFMFMIIFLMSVSPIRLYVLCGQRLWFRSPPRPQYVAECLARGRG